MLEIRTEDPNDTSPNAKPFGLWDDGLRYTWCDTYDDAMDDAEILMDGAVTEMDDAQSELDDAETRVEELKSSIARLEKSR